MKLKNMETEEYPDIEVGVNFKCIERVDGARKIMKVVDPEDLYKEFVNNSGDVDFISIFRGKIHYFKKMGNPKFIINY